MSGTSDSTSVGDLALQLVRGRLVAEEAARAMLQARTYALLRTITAMAAFVVAGLAFLNNSDIDLNAGSVATVVIARSTFPAT